MSENNYLEKSLAIGLFIHNNFQSIREYTKSSILGRAFVDSSGTVNQEEWSYLNALFLYSYNQFWQEIEYHEKT